MAKQTINIGSGPNTKTGDPLRSAFTKVNDNFTELYSSGISTNELVNGAHTLSLDGNGDLILPDDGGIVFDRANTTIRVGMGFHIASGEGISLEAIDETDPENLVYKNWRFNSNGGITFPTLTVPISDNANPSGTGQTLKFSDVSQQAIIYGPESTAETNSAQRIIIQGAPGYEGTGGEGGDVYLWAGPGGDTDGNGGDIKVRAGRGNGTGAGGYLNFQAGDSNTGTGGYINIEGGQSSTYGLGGDITINSHDGGIINLRTHNGITSQNWLFGEDGSITFPDTTVQTTAYTGATQPYLELTNTPFIIQPAVLDSPVEFTRTAEGSQTDAIDEGLTLARGAYGALFNTEEEAEYDDNSYISPIGTEWNSDGWGDLSGLPARTYTTFRSALNNQIGNYIIGSELVMHDTINDKYYKFSFSDWGQNNGGSFAYTRTLVEDPNYFKKTNYGDEVDEISAGLHITRNDNGWLYNPLEEEGHDDETPTGSVWNNDGWDDLSDTESRTYEPLETIWNNNFVDIVGSRMIMKDTTTDKYWAIEMLGWTQGGGGGGFNYLRYELDLTQLQQGITFADGTVLTSAEGVGRVKLTASGNRRIEEAHGYNSVYVTPRVTVDEITTGGDPVIWWDKEDLPGGSGNFRGAVIDYHAYTGEATIIGTIHIVDDDGEENVTHTEVSSGNTDSENDELWLVQNEGTISYRRIDGESKTLRIQWTAKVFYSSELYD